jgi:CRISPR-associated endonuclease Cas1
MAATATVAQQLRSRNSLEANATLENNSQLKEFSIWKPSHGVITLSGYGIGVRVDRGHLALEDGIGADRRNRRLPRVGHGLKRVVVIGSDGVVSLSALRWLADQKASFIMLDRDGSVLMTTGPVHSSEAKLRRAQALALQNGVALRISRELIDRKLAGQQKVASENLHDESTALAIRRFRSELAEAESVDAVRQIESYAAKIYWVAWRSLEIMFPKKDLPRVPEHWRTFGSRASSLTGSPRLATNPVNAMLNYLYALLEAEARLAAATLGLDPGIGVLHVDTPYRDSLACDLMEPIRPEVDAFVLGWLKRDPFLRDSFFEQRDGNCRLMAPFASKLSQTAPTWAHLVAPVAEWFGREIFNSTRSRQSHPAARLTQSNKREARGGTPFAARKPRFKPARICRGCGKQLEGPNTNCFECSKAINRERITRAAFLGRVAAQGPEARAKRAATRRTNAQAAREWNPSLP